MRYIQCHNGWWQIAWQFLIIKMKMIVFFFWIFHCERIWNIFPTVNKTISKIYRYLFIQYWFLCLKIMKKNVSNFLTVSWIYFSIIHKNSPRLARIFPFLLSIFPFSSKQPPFSNVKPILAFLIKHKWTKKKRFFLIQRWSVSNSKKVAKK